MNVTFNDFDQYFRELHGPEHGPYDWQQRLAGKAIAGRWPAQIDLPTGSGKTACLDVAIFALACQAFLKPVEQSAARRVFFCVNRRVIVDEAHQRARRIAQNIWTAERVPSATNVVLQKVAKALRNISGISDKGTPPLDVLELRGGIYRDNRWARSATQPTIVCTTVDQLGSRLLFRGYGVSSGAAPIQAALIAYDSLVLLDEAHISRPFSQTLEQVNRYLDPERWSEQKLGSRRMVFVPMTATPPDGADDSNVIRLEDKDRQNDGLNNRLTAGKPATLIQCQDIIKSAVGVAKSKAEGIPTAVGIIVNRVATAKAVFQRLKEDHPKSVVELVIGSMRPVDRDLQAERLRNLVGPKRPVKSELTSFIVATQCLEVGADYDFDVLITECASLDALRQRFGRLNRGGRDIAATAVILIDANQIKEDDDALDDKKPLDPIYGNALTRTWNWLFQYGAVTPQGQVETVETTPPKKGKPKPKSAAVDVRSINFGIDSFNELLKQHGDDGRIPEALLSPSAKLNAPVMLPAYLDLWCQTSPRPAPDPDVSLFIHGLQDGARDVQVCWRADLIEDNHLKRSDWCDVVALLPPTAAECMAVPISRMRRWLTEDQVKASVDESDLLTVQQTDEDSDRERTRLRTPCVLWKGARDSQLLTSPSALYPGCTLVLPVSAGGWNDLGHIPDGAAPLPLAKSDAADAANLESKKQETSKERGLSHIDVAEQAFLQAKDRAALRLHPAMKTRFPEVPGLFELLTRLADRDELLKMTELRSLLRAAGNELGSEAESATGLIKPGFLKRLADPNYGLEREDYPDGRGIVLTTRKRLESHTDWFLPSLDDGDDEPLKTQRQEPISLSDHTGHVATEMQAALDVLPVGELKSAFRDAVARHDWGKADERFQAMLRRMDRTDAWLWSETENSLLAKSDGMSQTKREREADRVRAELPKGFRHEMLSVQLAERCPGIQFMDQRDLLLHLIAAHHGCARPFAPVVIDNEYPEVTVAGVTLHGEQRKACPPHRLDSGIAERFWNLTKCYGWWGLAYLESLLRLADQQASANENSGAYDAVEQHTTEAAQ